MTLFLVLAVFAGLYALWLVFRLAIYALPFYAGLGALFWLIDHDYDYAAAILGGFGAGLAVLVTAELLFALVNAPALKAFIALVFALPTGFAGYHAARGIAGLALEPGVSLTILSWIGSLFVLTAAWRRVATPSPHHTNARGSLADS